LRVISKTDVNTSPEPIEKTLPVLKQGTFWKAPEQ